jgi:adenylate kinase
MIVVMLGPPAAGKGTQCELLAERLAVPHVSTGDLLRDAIARQTPLGKLAQPYLDRGELVPDDTMVSLVRDRLLQSDAQRGAILDGFPRTVDQAHNLDRTLAELGRKVDAVLYLRVPIEEVIERVAERYTCPRCGAIYHPRVSAPRVDGQCDNCGAELIQRTDDRPEVVRRRLEVYESQTAPLIDLYRKQHVLVEVDGAQSIERVLEDELDALAERGLLPLSRKN